jgi:hypothetical protein
MKISVGAPGRSGSGRVGHREKIWSTGSRLRASFDKRLFAPKLDRVFLLRIRL